MRQSKQELRIVKVVPEEGRDAIRSGRDDGPNRKEVPAGQSSASYPSSPERKGFSPESTRLVKAAVSSEISLELANVQVVRASERAAISISPRTAVRGPRGAARARATDGSETRGGAGRGGRGVVAVLWRYRNLPYAKSTVRTLDISRESACTPIRGGVA